MEDQKREEEDTGDGWRVEKRKKGIIREREKRTTRRRDKREIKNRGKPTYNREGVWTAWTGEEKEETKEKGD